MEIEKFYRINTKLNKNNENFFQREDGAITYTSEILGLTDNTFIFNQTVDFSNRRAPKHSKLMIDHISVLSANKDLTQYLPLKFKIFGNQMIEFGGCCKSTIDKLTMDKSDYFKTVTNLLYDDVDIINTNLSLPDPVIDFETSNDGIIYLTGPDSRFNSANNVYFTDFTTPLTDPTDLTINNAFALYGDGEINYILIQSVVNLFTEITIFGNPDLQQHTVTIDPKFNYNLYFQYAAMINDFLFILSYGDGIDPAPLSEDGIQLTLVNNAGIVYEKGIELSLILSEFGKFKTISTVGLDVTYITVKPILENNNTIPTRYVGFITTTGTLKSVYEITIDVTDAVPKLTFGRDMTLVLGPFLTETFIVAPSGDYNLFTVDGTNYVFYNRVGSVMNVTTFDGNKTQQYTYQLNPLLQTNTIPYQMRNIVYFNSVDSMVSMNLQSLEIIESNPFGLSKQNLIRINKKQIGFVDIEPTNTKLILINNTRENKFYRFSESYDDRKLLINLEGTNKSSLTLRADGTPLKELELLQIVVDFRIIYSTENKDVERPTNIRQGKNHKKIKNYKESTKSTVYDWKHRFTEELPKQLTVPDRLSKSKTPLRSSSCRPVRSTSCHRSNTIGS